MVNGQNVACKVENDKGERGGGGGEGRLHDAFCLYVCTWVQCCAFVVAWNTHRHNHVAFDILEIRSHHIEGSRGKGLGDDGLGPGVRDDNLPVDLHGVGGKRNERVGE